MWYFACRKKGNKNAKHFAHHNGAECPTAPETALHKLAKEILAEHIQIRLNDAATFEYKEAILEHAIDNIIADAKLNAKETNKLPLYVEMVVTSDISEAKKKTIEKNKLRVLKIDLSNTPRDIQKADLAKIVIDETENKILIEPTNNDGLFFGFLGGIGFLTVIFLLWQYLKPKPRKRRKV